MKSNKRGDWEKKGRKCGGAVEEERMWRINVEEKRNWEEKRWKRRGSGRRNGRRDEDVERKTVKG